MAAPMKTFRVLFLNNSLCFRRCLNLEKGLTYARYSSVRTTVKDILKNADKHLQQEVTTQGWVKSIRDQKELVFLHISDGTCFENLQVLLNSEQFNSAVKYDSCVEVKGQVVESPGGRQNVELKADTVDVIGPCDMLIYPFKQRTSHSLDYERSYPHLRVRSKSHSSLLRVRNTATMAIHNYFQNNGYCFVHTPILTTNDCEGAGEIFQVEPLKKELKQVSGETSEAKGYFGTPTFLTVSGQLHLEIITGGMRKAYNFGPTFRADQSTGRHHLAEFSMVEAEISFLNSLDELMAIMEEMFKQITTEIMNKNIEDVDYFHKNVADKRHKEMVEKVLNNKFERLTFAEAIELLLKNSHKLKVPVEMGHDLKKEHELFLTQLLERPVFITDFPVSIRPPFYARINDDSQTVAAVDLLVPGVGELIGGSLREERVDYLENSLESLGVLDQFQWYLDLRRYGATPHGGFGLGFERYIQFLLGISNIKDAIPFPRSIGNCQL